MKNPGLAAVLSFFVSGLGQIYNGQIGRGLAFLGAEVVGWLLTLVVIGWLVLPAVWIWGIYDAYNQATKINAQRAGSVSTSQS